MNLFEYNKKRLYRRKNININQEQLEQSIKKHKQDCANWERENRAWRNEYQRIRRAEKKAETQEIK